MSNNQALCRWYQQQCNDRWEHTYGIKIDTLDDPGWSLKIDLAETSLLDRAFREIKIDRSEQDWIRARRNGDVFEAHGGPNNLDDLIGHFLSWAT